MVICLEEISMWDGERIRICLPKGQCGEGFAVVLAVIRAEKLGDEQRITNLRSANDNSPARATRLIANESTGFVLLAPPVTSLQNLKEEKYAKFDDVSAPRHWPSYEGRADLGAQTCARMFSGRIADLSRSNVQRVCAVGAQPDSRIWQR